jgi:hypothetical protein
VVPDTRHTSRAAAHIRERVEEGARMSKELSYLLILVAIVTILIALLIKNPLIKLAVLAYEILP